MPRAATTSELISSIGVLVAPDDDRRCIDVEEQEVVVLDPVAEDVFLEREIEPRVGDAAVVDEEHEEKCTGERTSALERSGRGARYTSSDYVKQIAIDGCSHLDQRLQHMSLPLSNSRVALITYSGVPAITTDDRLLRDALVARGAEVDARPWDARADWSELSPASCCGRAGTFIIVRRSFCSGSTR